MKRILAIVLAMLMLLSGMAFAEEPQFDGEIIIGAMSDITGSGAANGMGEAFAYQMVADEINAKGGVLGKKLVIQQEDTNGTVEGCVNAINKLYSDPNVVACFGIMYSTQVMGVADIVLQSQRPLMYGGSSPSINELNNPYLFRMRPADDFVVTIYVDYIKNTLNPTKLGMIYAMDDFGTQGYNVAKAYCEANGIELIADGYSNGTKDFYSNLLKIQDAGCDAMIWWGHEEETSILARQRVELGMEAMPVYCSSGAGNNIFNELTNAADTNGIYGISESCDIGNDWDMFVEFKARFEEAYGEGINNNICGLVPAIYVLCDAIERAGTTDAEALCAALRETRDFKAISGYLTCDEKQNLNHNAIIYKLDNKQRVFVELYTAEVE